MTEVTNLLLAALVAGPLDTRLSLLLVVIAGAIVVTIDTARAVAHDGGAYGAPLPLAGAIGAGTAGGGDAGAMSKDLTAHGDGAGRAEGGSRTTVLARGLAVCCRGCTGSGDGGGVHARRSSEGTYNKGGGRRESKPEIIGWRRPCL